MMAASNTRDEGPPQYDPVKAWFVRDPPPAGPWIALEPWRAEDQRQRREEELDRYQNTAESHIPVDEIRDVKCIELESRMYTSVILHLAKGRGVGTTVQIEGADHIIVARVPPPSGEVWPDRPTAQDVTVEAATIRQAFRDACVLYPNAVLPFRSVQGPIRVVPWQIFSSPKWYAYLCVPVESQLKHPGTDLGVTPVIIPWEETYQSKPIPLPKGKDSCTPPKRKTRFQNLEL